MDEKRALISLGFTRKREGKLEEAVEIFRQALDLYPADPYLSSALADLYVMQNRLWEAEELIARVREENPEYRPALLVWGNLALKREEYQEAARYFEAAYRQRNDGYSRRRLVEAYLGQNEYDKALNLVRQGLEVEPDNISLHRLQGRIQERQGDTRGAIGAYRRVLEGDPKDQFSYQRLLQLESAGRPGQEVVREVGRLLSVGERRKNPHLRAWRARELKELGRWEEALAEYRRARELDPGNLFLQKQEAFCLYRMDRLEEALAIFQETLRRDPRDHVVRNTMLITFRKLQRLPEAVIFLEELIQEHPDYKPLWGIIRRVKKEAGLLKEKGKQGKGDGIG